MNEVTHVLNRAARRLFVDRLLRSLPFTLSVALAALLLLLLVERLFAVGLDWRLAGWVAGASALGASILWSVMKTRDRAAVARLVDREARLRESLSTALSLEGRTDAWSLAAIEQARDRAKAIDMRRALPFRAPRRWPAPIIAGMVFAIVWVAAPQADLFGREREDKAERQLTADVEQAKAETQVIDEQLKEMLAKLGEEPPVDPQEGSAEQPELNTPDEIRRAAIRRLTDAQDRLDALRSDGQSRSMDELRDQLRQLRQPGMGPINELVSAMQRGDFAKSSEKLAELMNHITEGALSPDQKKRLQEQLGKLADQMRQLAEKKENLENQLRQAGLDPGKLNTPGALEEAVRNAQGLSEQQRQELLQRIQDSQNAGERLGSMAQAMRQAAQNFSDDGRSGMEDMSQLAMELSDLEILEQELAQIDAAKSFAWGKITELSQCLGGPMPELSPFQQWRDRKLPLALRRGAGDGSGRFGSNVDTDTTKVKAPTKTNPGPIIGSTLVEGEQVRGESHAQFTELVVAGEQAAAEAIESKTTPREYHDALKHYFGRLKAKADAETATEPVAEPAQAPGAP